MIHDRIYKTEKINWQHVRDLQPGNLKVHYNISYLRKSILKYGIAKAYDVCEIDGELYWLDGHTRTDMLRTLQSEGVEIPELITANFCKVADKKEAIKILLEVHNQKINPIHKETLEEWTLEYEIDDINTSAISIEFEIDEPIDQDAENTIKENDTDFSIRLDFTEDDYRDITEKMKRLGGSKEKIVYEGVMSL